MGLTGDFIVLSLPMGVPGGFFVLGITISADSVSAVIFLVFIYQNKIDNLWGKVKSSYSGNCYKRLVISYMIHTLSI